MQPGFCYRVEIGNGNFISFRVLGGSPVQIQLPNSEIKLLDEVVRFYKEVNEIDCRSIFSTQNLILDSEDDLTFED